MVFAMKKKGDKKFVKSTEIIYGKNACFGCINSGNRNIFCIYILASKIDEYIRHIPKDLHYLIKKSTSHDMFCLTKEDSKHQGIALSVSCYKYKCIDDLLNTGDEERKTNLFILDHIQDPHNLGNIIRTSFCFSIDGIIVPERGACGITNAVVRTSAGYSEAMNICQVANLNQTIEKLKENGFWIIGFDVNTNNKMPLREIVKKYRKCAFVFGAEGDGMRENTKKISDIIVKLPMNENAESLNVANTISIVAWEVFNAGLE